MAGIGACGEYRVLLLPDHPTPVAKMTHTKDPVPFVLYGSAGEFSSDYVAGEYSEACAAESALKVDPGHQLMRIMVDGRLP